MRTLQRNEIKRLVTRIKKRLIHEKMVRTELRIVSKRNLKEYRLLFWRKHSDDLGGFYLASADKLIRLHDVLLYYLLKNIRKGNYLVSSTLVALEDRSFQNRLYIYSSGSFKSKGEIRP